MELTICCRTRQKLQDEERLVSSKVVVVVRPSCACHVRNGARVMSAKSAVATSNHCGVLEKIMGLRSVVAFREPSLLRKNSRLQQRE